MADSLFSAYAEVLSLAQSTKGDLEALLDPESGFCSRVRQICREQLEEYEEHNDELMTTEELDLLRMEENTWSLLQLVMPARKTARLPLLPPRQLLIENPYTPTSTLAQHIMNASPLLSELVVVREWLQDSAHTPPFLGITTGYWKFTKLSIMQSLRTGNAPAGLVKELDPDAADRDETKSLAADDANFEKGLLQALYGYVRCGKLDKAIELCQHVHQPWRAGSIRGSLLFQWKDISTEPLDGEPEQDEAELTWSGNRRRKLWKSVCTQAATNPNLSDQERIFYAALAPSPETSSVLKSACRTWEDHLWAQISIICEGKQTSEMARIGGCFWEGGLEAVDKGVQLTVDDESISEDGDEEDEWEKAVVRTLEGVKNVAVLEGPSGEHPFHFSQLQIILDRTGALLEVFAGGLRDGSYSPETFEYPIMTRFFAHLCLFLQMIEVAVPPLATQTILESYLQVLEAAGQRDLIAMYAGALGDNAVERYAMFLVSLELQADLGERKLALTRAREHGLDVDRVAIVTAERTIEKAFEYLPPLHGPLPSIIALQPPASDAEVFLLRSIEWTTYSDATYDTALEQANVILRYFLAAGRVQVAQKLLEMLPPDLASISEPEERATEYLHYRQFFVIWECLERVVECQALDLKHAGGGGPSMSKETKAAWIADYAALIEQTRDHILKLLTTEWLTTDGAEQPGISSAERKRRQDLQRIRQIYIPELVIRLHFVLFTSRHRIPSNLPKTLILANVVADSRYKLYDDFVGHDATLIAQPMTTTTMGRKRSSEQQQQHQKKGRLTDYLEAVRQAVVGGLEGGGSDPFRILQG